MSHVIDVHVLYTSSQNNPVGMGDRGDWLVIKDILSLAHSRSNEHMLQCMYMNHMIGAKVPSDVNRVVSNLNSTILPEQLHTCTPYQMVGGIFESHREKGQPRFPTIRHPYAPQPLSQSFPQRRVAFRLCAVNPFFCPFGKRNRCGERRGRGRGRRGKKKKRLINLVSSHLLVGLMPHSLLFNIRWRSIIYNRRRERMSQTGMSLSF